ncbi:antitoxin VapB family protein [Candidatus Woesearchaeota archaeon]|nr:antitoxin VapB family protein [Candidatus Woesearchaeota archaeon]
MVTKTLTIMEDVYGLLLRNKREEESFSEELRRLLSVKKRDPMELFGLISEEQGDKMLEDLKRIKEENIKLQKQRLKWNF